MVGLGRGVGQAGSNVLGVQVRVVLQDLGLVGTGGEQGQNVGDPHPSAPHSGTTVHDIGIDRDAVQE